MCAGCGLCRGSSPAPSPKDFNEENDMQVYIQPNGDVCLVHINPDTLSADENWRINEMLPAHQIEELFVGGDERTQELEGWSAQLDQREVELTERENELERQEKNLGIREAALDDLELRLSQGDTI